ncbi:metallophosphoesterase domain-containing protein 1 [Salpingoeca rosetta]|uniref:Metallophosphoesterase domain-containing protein 1 n=1 Tax=Salpingoeca rosetta (strain ATCC 50818 / BSB-021) TaxID=946362 RepID=F2U961_SALR5|nr:metallophosphoesterase domain-containing protein 1 [Salpingoeca rosetta]EGD73264.1 metallophosphoesterase domain-containing protein 1 [Salpingoeca rosetta]|eukprot:XP_004994295.1 metallophosphoesterase domain-containing protein 1 [Salpingoeca rosetta]
MSQKLLAERFASAWERFPRGLRGDPTRAYERLQVSLPFEQAAGVDPDSEKPENVLRCVCISDTHCRAAEIEAMPKGDVLIHAGDFTSLGRTKQVDVFSEFLKGLDFQHKIVIAGNHDLCFDDDYEALSKRFGVPTAELEAGREALNHCTYLLDSSVEIQGVKFYGSPWQPWFFDWAFNLERGDPCTAKWQEIPDDTDVLITHGPPVGHGDLCTSGQRAGCVDLLREIQTRVKPKLHVFGHIHEGYGTTTDGQTVFVNASTCTFNYRPTNPPLVFDVPIPAPVPSTSDSSSEKKAEE